MSNSFVFLLNSAWCVRCHLEPMDPLEINLWGWGTWGHERQLLKKVNRDLHTDRAAPASVRFFDAGVQILNRKRQIQHDAQMERIWSIPGVASKLLRCVICVKTPDVDLSRKNWEQEEIHIDSSCRVQ